MKKEDKWQDSFREASEEVSFWRKKYPKATFSEMGLFTYAPPKRNLRFSLGYCKPKPVCWKDCK